MEFLFTQGTWVSVDKSQNSEGSSNSGFCLSKNTEKLFQEIGQWSDHFNTMKSVQGSGDTRVGNIKVYPEFCTDELGGQRRIWVYLPPDYDTSGIAYPVMYIHDGQNVFDDVTSFAGEWCVDETLEHLFHSGMTKGIIVVAVDNGGDQRISEYTPFEHPIHGGGHAKRYVNFLVHRLKPWVDKSYRTLSDRNDTAIVGSSLGAVVSLYAGFSYPEVFGLLGLFSPAFWFSRREIFDFASTALSRKSDALPLRIYLDAGQLEDPESKENYIVNDVRAMYELFISSGFPNDRISLVIDELGSHSEASWRRRFPAAFVWMFQ